MIFFWGGKRWFLGAGVCLDCLDFVTKGMPMTFQSKMAHLYKTHLKTVKRFIIKNELDSSKHLKKVKNFLAG